MHIEARPTLRKKFVWIVLPQFLLITLLVVYYIFGCIIFRALDEELAARNISDIFLFEFTTLTTIGYGDIAPTTSAARLFCIPFSILGIPLTLLTLANAGKYVTRIFWIGVDAFAMRKSPSSRAGDAQMPLGAIFIGFLVIFICGSFFVRHNGQSFSFDDPYFGFISFTTVGFGDRLPVVTNWRELITVLTYLIWGIIFTCALFGNLSEYLRKIHYFGRRFRGARDVPVWMGGQSITVSQLLEVVANEFHASPREIRSVLHDLDDLVMAAAADNVSLAEESIVSSALSPSSDKQAPLVTNLEDFDIIDEFDEGVINYEENEDAENLTMTSPLLRKLAKVHFAATV